MPAKRGRSKSAKRTRSKSPKKVTRISCSYTGRGCAWKVNGRPTTRTALLKRKNVTAARLARLSATAQKRAMTRGVSKGRKQAVRKTKGPQCIISATGKCSWHLGGKPITLAALKAKGFSAAQLAAAKKSAKAGAIRKGVQLRRKSKSPQRKKSASPKRKTKSPARKRSKSPGQKRPFGKLGTYAKFLKLVYSVSANKAKLAKMEIGDKGKTIGRKYNAAGITSKNAAKEVTYTVKGKKFKAASTMEAAKKALSISDYTL